MSIFWLWRTDLRFRNKTHYQRLLHIARRYKVILVVPKLAHIRSEIEEVVSELVRCPLSLPGFLNHVLFFFYCFFAFFKRFRRIDMVYSPPDYSVIWCALVKGLFPNTLWVADMWDDPRLFVYLHEGNFIRRLGAILFNFFVRRALRLSDLVITIGTELNSNLPKIMVKEFGISPKKILPVTNGVDLNMFRPRNDFRNDCESELRLVYVGYIKKYVGIKDLLEALRMALKSIPRIRLMLVGFATRDDKRWLDKTIASYDLEDNIIFRGVVPSDEVPEIIDKSHVCVYPFPGHKDLDNVFPVKVYEYLAMGKPVVATDLSGVKSIVVDGFNGLIVRPSEPDEFAQSFIKLYRDKGLYHELARNARGSVEKYGWDVVNENVVTKLSMLLSDYWGTRSK